MAADREGESATDNDGEIEEAVHAGPGFQSAATLLRCQGGADLDATRERGFLSPRFRSAAAMAGWDEEALFAASLVVEDTPVREFKGKKRADARLKSPPTTNSRRKRRSRRQTTPPIPPVTLSLDEEETTEEGIHVTVEEKRDTEATCTTTEKGKDRGGGSDPAEKAPAVAAAIPCLDRLREELSCAICLDICFEPSTTPCGHSFCKKCLKCSATKCGRRCPKCRELISNARACTVNTVLWNTIQLLFPVEVEARRKAPPEETTRDRELRIRSPRMDGSDNVNGSSSGRNNNNNNNDARTRISGMRSAARGVARLMESDREMMRRVAAAPSQSEDAALALRLQREEFLGAFRETQQPQTQQPQRSTVYLARASLRAMATRAIQQHNRRR